MRGARDIMESTRLASPSRKKSESFSFQFSGNGYCTAKALAFPRTLTFALTNDLGNFGAVTGK